MSYSPAEWRTMEPLARNAEVVARPHPERRDRCTERQVALGAGARWLGALRDPFTREGDPRIISQFTNYWPPHDVVGRDLA